ncbi:MAG: hypothetical protein H7A51_18090 [Akkermansiaceae bacterium]|nr:hypothetical protein [Akkermansiaceae bacterium]
MALAPHPNPVVAGSENAYTPTSGGSPNKYADAPGYINQGDILEKLGSVLTIRGDTFTIRAYGDARDASGKIIAQARCEATIQRVPEYMDAEEDEYPEAAYAQLRSELNKRYGRKFRLIAFRWLNQSE